MVLKVGSKSYLTALRENKELPAAQAFPVSSAECVVEVYGKRKG